MNTGKDVLIGKFLSGNASPSEIKDLDEWLAANPDNHLVFKATEKIWYASQALKKDIAVDTQSAWEEFKSLTPKRTGIRGLTSPFFLKMAAVLILAICTALVLLIVLPNPDNKKSQLAQENRLSN